MGISLRAQGQTSYTAAVALQSMAPSMAIRCTNTVSASPPAPPACILRPIEFLPGPRGQRLHPIAVVWPCERDPAARTRQ